MPNFQEHYESLLARHYTWLWGGFKLKAEENSTFFESKGITPALSGRAADLGCGSGFQAIPLAKAGYSVTAIDLSQPLLDELTQHGTGLDITPVQGDILALPTYCPDPLELAVCMGDTLTHLPDKSDVRKMFITVFKTLEHGGNFIISYRDLSFELTGLDRFIPIRADETANFTCFLEYHEETVTVHDLVNERTDDGWQLNKSSYSKLRLPVDWVVATLKEAGFTIAFQDIQMGLATLIAKKA